MVRFGHISLPLSLILFAIIGLGSGLRLGLYTWWLRFTAANTGPWWYQLFLPACTYVFLDYLYPRVFPWTLGATQLDATWLIQIADITGVHGITFLLVAVNVVVTTVLSRPPQVSSASRWVMVAIISLFLFVTLSYGSWRIRDVRRSMSTAADFRVALIQPNIGIDEKGTRQSRDTHWNLQVAMSRATLTAVPDLIIWPETMYPYAVPTGVDRLLLPQLNGQARPHWLIGALVYNARTQPVDYFNSALLVAPSTRILERYNKRHLLAFGEYIPLRQYFPFLRNISPAIGELTAGTGGGLVTLPSAASHGPIAIGPLICYEDILPKAGRQAVKDGAELLVNLTNNAWFGRSHAPYQHRLLAAFRAVENRVYLVRATNTGLTSIIDPIGHELATLPTDQAKSVIKTIQPLRLSTFYTRYGDLFAQSCGLVTLAFPILYFRYKHSNYKVL